MKLTHFLPAAALFAGLLLSPALAQETPKKEAAPKPAPTALEAVLQRWNAAGNQLITMAEDFPEDKFDFKPTPEVRTFAEQLLHVAGVNNLLGMAVRGEKEVESDLPRDQYKTRAEIAAAVKKSFAEGAEIIRAKGEAGLSTPVKFPFGNSMIRLGDLADFLSAHAQEHYGQLVVYYRLNKLVPPASRPRK